MNNAVIILEMRFLSGDKPLKAFADIEIDGWLIIRDWRVIKYEGKAAHVAPPQVSWRNAKGEVQHKSIIALPDEERGQVDVAILKSYIEKAGEQNEQTKT